MYKAYIIDLDGTAYLGTKVIPETIDFVKRCKDNNKKILFLTNNASATQGQIYNKLKSYGYDILEDEVFTSSIAISNFLEKKDVKAYLIGDQGLKTALKEKNIKFSENLSLKENIDEIGELNAVIMGYTNKLNYDDLAVASIILQKNDSTLYATNMDQVLPTELGGLPGNGSFVNLLESVNKKTAICVGKPNAFIMDEALKILDLNKEDVCMVGDNYDTDILSGINNGIDTIYVETGVTSLKEVELKEKQPTYKVKNLSFYKGIK